MRLQAEDEPGRKDLASAEADGPLDGEGDHEERAEVDGVHDRPAALQQFEEGRQFLVLALGGAFGGRRGRFGRCRGIGRRFGGAGGGEHRRTEDEREGEQKDRGMA